MPKQYIKRPPPPGEVWDESFWRAYRSGNALAPFSRTYECLGLMVVNKNVRHPFNPGAVRELSVDIHALASRICSSFPGLEVVPAAIGGCEFDKDIDTLLEKYGEKVWGERLEDREHLIMPSADSLYTTDLTWAHDKDCIRVFVHQWVFMRAIKLQQYIVCKQTRDLKKAAQRGATTGINPALHKSRKASSRPTQTQTTGTPLTTAADWSHLVPAGDGSGLCLARDAASVDTESFLKSQQLPSHVFSHTNHQANSTPNTLDADQTCRDATTIGHPLSPSPSHSPTTPSSLSNRQASITDTLVKYIYEPHNHPQSHDKLSALKHIELEWTHNAPYYRTTMQADYNTFESVLSAWLAIQRTLLAWTNPAQYAQLDQRTLLETKLRNMYTEWSSMTYYFDEEPLASGKVVARLFARMMGVLGEEGVRRGEGSLGGLDRRVEIVIWSSSAVGGVLGL